MRHPLRPALLVVVLLAVYAVGGAAVASAGGTSDAVTVEGTVTGVDGAPAENATVVVGDFAMLTKLSPDELRSVVADDPQDLTVAETDVDGRYLIDAPTDGRDAVVALTDEGISEIVRLGDQDATVDLRLHERRPLAVHAAAAPAGSGEVTRLYVDLRNTGDEPLANLTVSLGSLPDGWQVEGVHTDGTFDEGERTLRWASVDPGDEADAVLALAVPADASFGEYRIALTAGSDSHPVAVENATVEVRPERTAGPTETVLDGDGGPDDGAERSGSPTATPDDPGSPVAAPGFGAVAALAAAALLAGLAGPRRRGT